VYKLGDVWCNNARKMFAYFYNFVKKMQQWTYPVDYLRIRSTNYSNQLGCFFANVFALVF